MDLETGERWVARLSPGRIPWWIFDKKRRVAGTKARDYLSALKIITAGPTHTVADRLKAIQHALSPLLGADDDWRFEHRTRDIASAELLAYVLDQSFSARRPTAASRMIPKVGLSETFVTPCLEFLRKARRRKSVTTIACAPSASTASISRSSISTATMLDVGR